MPSTFEAEALMLLRQVAADVQAIRAAVERAHRPETDAAAIACLREIFAQLGGDYLFMTGDLIEHAELPQCTSLHAALVAAVGSPLSAKRVGKWLRRLKGRDLGGLILERAGEDRDGALWVLRRVCGS